MKLDLFSKRDPASLQIQKRLSWEKRWGSGNDNPRGIARE